MGTRSGLFSKGISVTAGSVSNMKLKGLSMIGKVRPVFITVSLLNTVQLIGPFY